MELYEKFDQGKKSHTYQRIGSDYQVNVFLGYNDDGNMSMVITEPGVAAHIKSSKLIDVNMRKRDDGKMALSFDLMDNSYSSMFMLFCKDMIVVCEKGGSEMAISNAIVRWKYWKELFGRKQSQLLSHNELKGLFGELMEIKNTFIPNVGVKNAIEAWRGPMLGHKDFEIFDTWYEIKTINDGAIQIIISSLEQLDADTNGHLVIVRVEDASSVSYRALSLNQLVLKIMNMIDDPDDMEAFQIKLDNMGFVMLPDYDNICFVYKGRQQYIVKEGFPKITRKDVNPAIGNIKYSILIDGIIDYMEG